jgi:hypothetical protein
MAFQSLARGFRTGDGAFVTVFQRGQRIDKEIGGRASANTNDAAGWCSFRDMVGGRLSHRLFKFVLSHCWFLNGATHILTPLTPENGHENLAL